MDPVADVVGDSVVDVGGSAVVEVVPDGVEEVAVVVGVVVGVDVDGAEVVEVGEVADVVEVVDGELVGPLVVVTVPEEGAAVELEVGETGAADGPDAGLGPVAEGTLEPGAAVGLRAVGPPVLGRIPGMGHDGGAMGDPPRPVWEPATSNRLTWTWSIWFWVGLPRSSISRQPSAGRSTFQMCCCQMT